jgi:predicted metal-dependent phosphoesterase TrpH
MLVDLHCHSTCSDGSLEPDELTSLARRKSLELFCLTDHDSCAGSSATAAAWPGGPVVRGVELSCSHETAIVHLLIYDAERDDTRWAVLEHRLEELSRARRRRVHEICARLFARGIVIDATQILRDAGTASVGRPHVARALVAAGAVSSLKDAFSRWLYDGGPVDVPMPRPSLDEALALAETAGGRTSLAHPSVLGDGAVDIVRRFAGAGLGAVEAHCVSYSRQERERWANLARSHDLVVTGGSDFHDGGMPVAGGLGVVMTDHDGATLREWLRVSFC